MWSEVPGKSAAALRQRGFWVQDGAVENELATELREEILRCHEDPGLGFFFLPPSSGGKRYHDIGWWVVYTKKKQEEFSQDGLINAGE